MEAAAATGFKHVPPAVRAKCLKDLGIGGLRLAHQQAGALIHAYRDDWKWSDWDVARAMKHILPATKQDAPKRTPPPEADVYGNTLRDELKDIIAAAEASKAALDAPPKAADQAVSGQDGGVDASVLTAFNVVQNMGKGCPKGFFMNITFMFVSSTPLRMLLAA